MNCYYHNDRTAVANCSTCGRPLCADCAESFNPPTCAHCANDIVNEVKGEMIKSILLSIVFMIIGVIVIESPSGILLAGIPYGWSILNRITPSMFLWLSWIGWIVYLLIKLVLAYFIGLIALPIKLVQWITQLVRAKKLQDSLK